jgi:arylsulfatase A-like enzyme
VGRAAVNEHAWPIIFGRSLRLSSHWVGRASVGAASVVLATGCGQSPQGVDLFRSSRARLVEASAASLHRQELQDELGKPRRIHNVVRASIPAPPPSRFRFVADVPDDGRLVLAAGIPGRYRDASAVEFVVAVRRRGRESTVLSRLVDPANRPGDRSWVPLEADLSGYAGKGVEIVLETRGFERLSAPDRAYWGTPTIATARSAGAPLVVVYLVDALRADHLPLYGYSRDTAPELTRFASDAVVFDQAIASSSWTKPSVASLFTSLLPREHGCVRFFSPLGPGLVTLAERLHERGYATGGVVENPFLGAKSMQFDQGFDLFEVPPSRHAGLVVDAALAFLDARRGQPTFLYAHAMDTHVPYLPPSPFDRLFPPLPEPGRGAARPFSDYREPADRDRIIGQYDGAIAYGDQEFGRFLEGLRERGLYDRAMIVFLADHGEELFDHGGWDHGRTLFDELVRVPLVVKYPRGREAGRRVARQVQLVDVLPTILKTQGIPEPPGIVGRSLDESFHATGPERPAVLETSYYEHVVYGARTSEAKYVRDFHPANVKVFFDLRRDPGERQGTEGMLGAQDLKRVADAYMYSGLHSRVRVDGADDYDLQLRTTGRVEVVGRVGLGTAERADVAEDGRAVVVRLGRAADRRRRVELELVTWPRGAPLWIDGTRGGRRLQPSEIRVAAAGLRAGSVPFLVPDDEDLAADTADPFSPPPPGASGVSVWLVAPGNGSVVPLDDETRESMKALGYLR